MCTMVAQPITVNPPDVFKFTEIRQLIWSASRCLPNHESTRNETLTNAIENGVTPMGTVACWLSYHEHTRRQSLSQLIIIIFHNRIIALGGVSCYMANCIRPTADRMPFGQCR